MKPPPFDYHDPATLDEALDLLSALRDDAAVLAGGQSLIPLLNMRLAAPAAVVDIRRIGLAEIRVRAEALTVGAMTRAADLEHHGEASGAVPCLREALREVGHPQIRNRTTIGGNLAHADPASEVPAVLVALDGTVALESRARGERVVEAAEFFLGVFTTAREPDELVTEVTFPRFPGRSTFVEFARRPGDFALVGTCLCLAIEDGLVAEARIALSGVGGRPVRAREAEAVLAGHPPDENRLREAARSAASGLEPASDIHGSAAYRRALAAVLVERGLSKLAGEAA